MEQQFSISGGGSVIPHHRQEAAQYLECVQHLSRVFTKVSTAKERSYTFNMELRKCYEDANKLSNKGLANKINEFLVKYRMPLTEEAFRTHINSDASLVEKLLEGAQPIQAARKREREEVEADVPKAPQPLKKAAVDESPGSVEKVDDAFSQALAPKTQKPVEPAKVRGTRKKRGRKEAEEPQAPQPPKKATVDQAQKQHDALSERIAKLESKNGLTPTDKANLTKIHKIAMAEGFFDLTGRIDAIRGNYPIKGKKAREKKPVPPPPSAIQMKERTIKMDEAKFGTGIKKTVGKAKRYATWAFDNIVKPIGRPLMRGGSAVVNRARTIRGPLIGIAMYNLPQLASVALTGDPIEAAFYAAKLYAVAEGVNFAWNQARPYLPQSPLFGAQSPPQ